MKRIACRQCFLWQRSQFMQVVERFVIKTFYVKNSLHFKSLKAQLTILTE